ncbi:SH3 domain-containing protein [Tropicimonas aquimaris]|uniref:SH3 domain-containing protein n=1 Tax=Tropicimonas aquimaris TaxID=914152 RepID=A0ABW3ITS9_9RHOB
MLGRYVTGTLLVLGVAMLMAPPAPEADVEDVQVTRSETSPTALNAPKRVDLAKASDAAPVAVATADAAPVAASSEDADAVHAAILEALSLDQSEDAPGAEQASVEPASLADTDEPDGEPVGLMAGLGDPGFLAVPTENVRDAEAQSAGSSRFLVTGNRVNVRSGPSTAFDIVGSVVAGDAVELVAFAGDGWAQIRLPDGPEGYMSRNFLQEE